MLFIDEASLLRSIHQAQISHLHVYSVVIRLRLSFTSISIIINSQNKAVCLSIAHARWTVRSCLSFHRSAFINVLSELKWFDLMEVIWGPSLVFVFPPEWFCILLGRPVFLHTGPTADQTPAFGWQNWKYGDRATKNVYREILKSFFSNQAKVVFYFTLYRKGISARRYSSFLHLQHIHEICTHQRVQCCLVLVLVHHEHHVNHVLMAYLPVLVRLQQGSGSIRIYSKCIRLQAAGGTENWSVSNLKLWLGPKDDSGKW